MHDIGGTERGPFGDPPHWGDPKIVSNRKGTSRERPTEWCQLNEGPPSSNCLFFDRIGPQKNIRCRDPNAARPVYGLVSRLLYSHNFRHLPVKLHAVETPDKFDKDSLLLFLFLFFFFFFLTFSALSPKRERERIFDRIYVSLFILQQVYPGYLLGLMLSDEIRTGRARFLFFFFLFFSRDESTTRE